MPVVPAAHPRTPWDERAYALELHVGIATPTGLVGLGVDVSPTRWLSVDCRGGTNVVGLEAGCGARARLAPVDEQAFYFGAGASLGPHAQTEVTKDGLFGLLTGALSQMGHTRHGSRRWDMAYWTNLEVGHETRQWTGFTLRAYLGLAVLMNPDDGRSQREDHEELLEPSNALAYGGFGFGWAL